MSDKPNAMELLEQASRSLTDARFNAMQDPLSAGQQAMVDGWAELRSRIDAHLATPSETAALRAQVAEWERIKALYRKEWEARRKYWHRKNQYLGHSHDVDGVWDSDNGAIAGCECAACAMHRAALAQIESEGVER